jgi:response regulator RpfG family c-di-GMP phosphodiesterase
MSERILFVDDEPAVLDGYRRLLHKEFSLDTAVGGPEGLTAIAERGPYAVVVSDIRMPEMDGVQFLAKVRSQSPDTVRMALTGHADIEAAINAVNEGAIFRFLTKPCPKETLAKAITAALMQYRLITAERELLEKTLSGSIGVLIDVLSLVNPAAFSRAMRIRRYVQHITDKRKMEAPWRFAVAAMLSQLGCVTLHPETIEAVYAGQKLPADEQARFDAHPAIARDLLSNIPRLEPVAWMIAHQQSPVSAFKSAGNRESQELITQGAQMLRTALAYDRLISRGHTHEKALGELRAQPAEFDPALVDDLADLEPETERKDVRDCPISELQCGMILREEVRTNNGLLVVARGQEVTYPLLMRLRNFWQRKAIPNSVVVLAPHTEKGAVALGAQSGPAPR